MEFQVKLNYQPDQSCRPRLGQALRKKRHPKQVFNCSIKAGCLGYINRPEEAMEKRFELSKQKDTLKSGFKQRGVFFSSIRF